MTPTFVARCMTCQQPSGWVKSNRAVVVNGNQQGVVERGFRCVRCGQFQTAQQDLRGHLWVREA